MKSENESPQESNQSNYNILNHLADYCKYLYEEEKDRTERLERKLNIFTVVYTMCILYGNCLNLDYLDY